MKKILAGAAACAGIICILLGIYWKSKSAVAVSIIGGADGPTSVFVAGKIGGDFAVGILITGIFLVLAGVWYYSRRHK